MAAAENFSSHEEQSMCPLESHPVMPKGVMAVKTASL